MTNNTMTNQSSIEHTVMRRVHRVRVLRFLISNLTVSGLLLVLALWGIGREVWVAKVFSNGPQDMLGQAKYLLYALRHTDFMVQALMAIMVAATIQLARSCAAILTARLAPSHA